MTEILCYKDSYMKEFKAEVEYVTEAGVVLDRTVFYPGGGGQPCDKGDIRFGTESSIVKKISRDNGRLVHNLIGTIPEVGTQVYGQIDWNYRYQLMRTHTALHILCGVVWRDFRAKVTGGDMKPLSARMDFELDKMSSDFAEEVERLVNQEIILDRQVEVDHISREEAFSNPDLIRTKINLLPKDIQEIRTIDIVGLDLQADGGTHVERTSEVGKVSVVGHESKGRINKRLRIEIK